MAIMLKTLLLAQLPQTPHDVLHLVDDGLAKTMHWMRSTISTTLKASPQALTFSQCVLLNIPFIAEWQTICWIKEALVNNTLIKTNQRYINYDDFVGECVLKYDQIVKGKRAVKISGPFHIVHVHVKGTITIQLRLGTIESFNICCTIPYMKPLA